MLVVVEVEATSTFQAAMPGELRAVLFICFVLNLFFFLLWSEYNFMVKNIYVDNSTDCHCSCICREDVRIKTVAVASGTVQQSVDTNV